MCVRICVFLIIARLTSLSLPGGWSDHATLRRERTQDRSGQEVEETEEAEEEDKDRTATKLHFDYTVHMLYTILPFKIFAWNI